MNIDYELVERIGATHYACGVYYKAVGTLRCWVNGRWSDGPSSVNFILEQLKPIPSKPTRTEYVKVELNHHDPHKISKIINEAVKNGVGSFYFKCDSYVECNCMGEVAFNAEQDNLYRRIEKEVDWKKEMFNFISGRVTNYKKDNATVADLSIDYLIDCYPDTFLEMCRVALRANGELK